MLKLQTYILLHIIAKILSSQIEIYLYCIGLCTGQNGNSEINFNKIPSPFDYNPPVYKSSFQTSQSYLTFQSEDFFFPAITGHVKVDGYSFYIGISNYFTYPSNAKKYEFYEKNEPRILQYLIADLTAVYRTTQIIFNIPQGNQLHDAQFPSFKDNCLKIFYSKNDNPFNFSQLFKPLILNLPQLQSYTLTFPTNFDGTINGFTVSNNEIIITSSNSTLDITLGVHQYINITSAGKTSTKTCNGFAIISSLPTGCESYNTNTNKCDKCFENFYIDTEGSCNPIEEGNYYNGKEYRQCYESCKSCKYGGNADVHNCEECNSKFSQMFDPPYRDYKFCFQDCNSVELIEQFEPTKLSYCTIGCPMDHYNYENRLCLTLNQASALGMFVIPEERTAVKECPNKYPAHTFYNDEGTFISCAPSCSSSSYTYYDEKGKIYCVKYPPKGMNYISIDKVLSNTRKDDPLLQYYNLTLDEDPTRVLFIETCSVLGYYNYMEIISFDPFTIINICLKELSNSILEYYNGTDLIYLKECLMGTVTYIDTNKCALSYIECREDQFFCNGTKCVDNCTLCGLNYYDYVNRSCLQSCEGLYLMQTPGDPQPSCVLSCPFDFPYIKAGNYCTADCGDLFINKDNKCVSQCLTDELYIDIDNKRCISSTEGKFLIENTNNVTSNCSEFYYVEPMLGMCVGKCPDNANKVDTRTRQCVSKCPLSAPFLKLKNAQMLHDECVISCPGKVLNKQCVDDCSINTDIQNFWSFEQNLMKCENSCVQLNDYCFEKEPTNIVLPEDEIEEEDDTKEEEYTTDDDINITDYITALYALINKSFPSKFKKVEIFYENFTIQSFPFDDPFDLSDKKTILFLGECASILKKTYNIDNLFVFKADLYRFDSNINQVEYLIYSPDGEQLNLTLCKHISIFIQTILTNSSELNLTLFNLMNSQFGIDILNTSSPFYNDICFPFSSEENTDVILRDRRKDYYPNISLCDIGCKYAGSDNETMIITCKCEIKTELSPEIVSLLEPEYFTSLLEETNIFLFKCYHIFIDIKKWRKNFGFYLIGGLIIINIILLLALLCNYRIKKGILISKMFSPPKQNNSEYSVMVGKTHSNLSNINRNEYRKNIIYFPDSSFDEITKEKTNLAKVFFEILAEKIDFCQIFCFSNEFEFMIISISAYIFSFNLDFTTNAFLFSDDVISEKYSNGGKMRFLRSILLSTASNIISNAISFIVLKFINYKEILELFAKEKGNDILKLLAIKRYFYFFQIRLFFYYFLNILFSGVFFYYIVIFCDVYKNSKYDWLQDCALGIVTELLLLLARSFIISIFKFISIKYAFKKLYNFSIYLENFNCIISL